ncbi:heterokaryon incompatibility domain-containing protein [Trichoderma austrokoningii]
MESTSPNVADDPEWLYRQLPLSNLEIRLLKLEPSKGPSAEIRASLIKYNLQERRKDVTFQALSYTWGPNLSANHIIVNGVKLPHRQETNRSIDLWNHQIPMMNMIYIRASELIIRLGPPSFDSQLAIQSLLELGSNSPYDKLNTLENDVWQAIQSLLERPWWKPMAYVLWTNVVVAAARMKAHQDDQRQSFPAITDILELDSLRDTAGHYCLRSTPQALFDLNMFSVLPSNRLETRYGESVAKVYTDFAAMLLLGEPGLEILRQCGNGDRDLPSWPLPFRNIQRYFDKPTKADGSGELSSVRFSYHAPPMTLEDDILRQRRIKRLEMAVEGSAVIKTLEDKDQLRELLHREDVMVVVAHENPHLPGDPDALQQGELITERDMKRWLLQELKHSIDASFKIDRKTKILQSMGIFFVENVDKDWTDATRFMVAVSCCKRLAMSNKKACVRYPTANELLDAFWSTLFVGQATGKQDLRYEDWLPETSKSWSPGRPPMTAKTAYLVELAEMDEAVDQSLVILNTETEGCISGLFNQLDPQLRERAFPQYDDAYPYDIYHRPFDLANIVPDPYWECRRRSDELAKRQAKERRLNHITSDLIGADDAKHSARRLLHQAISNADEALRQQPSLVPQDTLKAGIEKFALGRRFFITKKGYFRLGPQKLEPGDRVAVLFGFGVPFLLRKCPTIAGTRAWKIIGECYVQGIMQGEVIQNWELGTSEAQILLLV